MQEDTKTALRLAIKQSMPVAKTLAQKISKPYPVFQSKEGGYEITLTTGPDVPNLLLSINKYLEGVSTEFLTFLCSEYPDLNWTTELGGSTMSIATFDRSYILRLCIIELWSRYKSLDCSIEQINSLLDEFGHFMDSPTIKFRAVVPVHNLTIPPLSEVQLTDILRVKGLSDDQISSRLEHEGNYPSYAVGLRGLRVYRAIIEKDIELKKISPDELTNSELATVLRADFDKVITALRTLKSGWISYDSLTYEPTSFCPIGMGKTYFPEPSLPIGNYTILTEEIPDVEEYCRKIYLVSEVALSTACSRLADAENRVSPRDKIMDAVIGLEAILLGAVDGRQGELKFRFSLNYSTLFASPEEKLSAYKTAKDLYDLRSHIAHGNSFSSTEHRLGNEKLSVESVAQKACEILRQVIKSFLDKDARETYKNPAYWEKQYFGVSDS